jgi:protein TonB
MFADTVIIKEEPKEIKISLKQIVEKQEPALVVEPVEEVPSKTEIVEQNIEPLLEIPTPIKKKIEKPKKEKVIEKKIVEKQDSKPIQEVEKVVNTTVVEKTTVEEKTVQSKPMIDDKKDYLDKYLAQIRDLINKNVKYPSKAKKLSIEGIVIVKFKILEDGTVQNIEIIDGHKFLQTSTIEAIEEASKNFPKTNQSIEIQVPIEYKLI